MKTLLHVKSALLIAYVALCTHLVLTVLQAEPGVGDTAIVTGE
jgi:hypothetical protein